MASKGLLILKKMNVKKFHYIFLKAFNGAKWEEVSLPILGVNVYFPEIAGPVKAPFFESSIEFNEINLADLQESNTYIITLPKISDSNIKA